MFEQETTAGDVLTDAALGAIAGVAATAAMGPLTTYLAKRQPEAARRQEKAVNDRLGAPPPVKVAEKATTALGTSLPPLRRSLAGNVVHYGFGTFWGAVLGALSARWKTLPPGAGVALGILLWTSMDEGALPALGLSGKPREYPRQSHVRGLAAHVLYGVVLDRSLALLRGALGR
ncbi:MAG TPA: DUF1440 domain-containing protein [Myxococcaceae bacterium]|nr:DUF1440 domain-containing protein [Myxococcaceae bacterium]